MAPTRVREPFHRDGWVNEEKVDSSRIIACKDRDRVRMLSRHGVDHTKRVVDVAAAITKLSPTRWSWTARWRFSTSSSGPGSSGCASPTRTTTLRCRARR